MAGPQTHLEIPHNGKAQSVQKAPDGLCTSKRKNVGDESLECKILLHSNGKSLVMLPVPGLASSLPTQNSPEQIKNLSTNGHESDGADLERDTNKRTRGHMQHKTLRVRAEETSSRGILKDQGLPRGTVK